MNSNLYLSDVMKLGEGNKHICILNYSQLIAASKMQL